ncbi:hypothetical protein PoB_003999700 [Plakobranchus ocellatus]|uniref:Uncharacterized protein n=1 Tax=Plakobranchus ocellatus TaxID=259542 RepID=A0AAV4B1S7_9GAST|nr:hypothetical protein PoB_003999700 [Plakobranchus ocellatus]
MAEEIVDHDNDDDGVVVVVVVTVESNQDATPGSPMLESSVGSALISFFYFPKFHKTEKAEESNADNSTKRSSSFHESGSLEKEESQEMTDSSIDSESYNLTSESSVAGNA